MNTLTTVAASSMMLFASTALATTTFDTDMAIGRIFAEGGAPGSDAGFYLSDPRLAGKCKYGIMYIDLGTDAGKASFSLLSAAKTAGWHVKRIDYSIDSAGVCLSSGLHVE